MASAPTSHQIPIAGNATVAKHIDLRPSLLRLGLGARLALAFIAIAVIWTLALAVRS